MTENQTYDNCKYFSIRNLCPYREHKLMKEFISDIDIPSGIPKMLDFSKKEEVNKICSSCNKFKIH